MATVDLGRIKFVWKGAYSASTAYVADDVVESSGSAYVCIAATTGNAPPNATYWELMSQKGVDADLLTISGTVQGDIYYNNGSAIARLAPGTSGQFLKTQGASANPAWATVDVSGRVLQYMTQIDTAEYSFTNSWASGKTWDNMTGITSGSNLKITYNIYARDDSTGWGGLYTQIEFSSDGGSNWTDWRSDGYSSGNVMIEGTTGKIGQSMRVILVENWTASQFRLRFKHKSYNSTVVMNDIGESDLGVSSNYSNYDANGTAPSGITPTQWARNSILIEEIAT